MATAANILYNAWPAKWSIKVLSTKLVSLRGTETHPEPGHALYSYRCGALFMDEIVKLYNEHLGIPFPDRRGDEVMGVDLVLIDSETAGLIEKYIGSRGQLSGNDYKILKHCHSDLKTVVRELSGTDRQYFARLQTIAGLMLEKIKDGNTYTTTDKNSYKQEWEKYFLKIREILNDWDPIGVADFVDDEYDAMNFRTLTVLMNKRDKKEIREILADYTKNEMAIAVDNDTLDKVAGRISTISLD